MVFFAPLVGTAALFVSFVAAAPTPGDSAIGQEVAVSAPNGTPMSDTAMPMATGSSYGGSYGGGSSMGSGYGGSYGGSSMGSYGGSYGGGYSSMDSMSSSDMMTSTVSSYMASSTMSSYNSYSSPSYGSGGSSYGGSGYDSCVQQCMASYAPPMATYMPSAATATMGSSGSGATHTVYVAPTQGVLRYVPFAVNASIGDTVQFIWGANNHTVTKSSELELCNKTTTAPFASGEQNKDFMFTQVVNDTQPTFFYCGTPSHCEKGMYGIINPPNAAGSASAVSAMMPAMMSNSSSMAAMGSYTSMQTMNNTGAAAWGANMDMSAIPSWAQSSFVENVMYTRQFLAANPETVNADSSVNIGAAGNNPLMIPADISQALAANGTSTSTTPASTSTAATSTRTTAASTAKTNGAGPVVSSSGALIGAMVVLGAIMSL